MKRNLICVVIVLLVCSGILLAKRPPKPVYNQDWWFSYSNGMPSHPYAMSGGLFYFDFPTYRGSLPCYPRCDWVGYLQRHYTQPTLLSGSIALTYAITTTGSPVFNYLIEAGNTCQFPASFRFYFEHYNVDSYNEFHRWWSNPIYAELKTAGVTDVEVSLDPSQWTSVYGKRGSDFPLQFTETVSNVGGSGVTFGGGCFFGHGVNVSGGTAQLIVTSYEVLP